MVDIVADVRYPDGYEVRWYDDEIVVLSDEEALSLMEQHVCG